MSDPLFDADDDAATPLTAEEREGLIPAYITLRHELNEAEQIGIEGADRWAFARKRDVLDERFLKSLHKRMFGQVWRWAGQFRTTGRNIGVDAYRIGMELHHLLEAAGAALMFLPPYSPDFNPIEKAFARLKAMLRKAGERTVTGLWNMIGRLVDIFQPNECANYFSSCGYDPD